jgi:hypothetical protein
VFFEQREPHQVVPENKDLGAWLKQGILEQTLASPQSVTDRGMRPRARESRGERAPAASRSFAFPEKAKSKGKGLHP